MHFWSPDVHEVIPESVPTHCVVGAGLFKVREVDERVTKVVEGRRVVPETLPEIRVVRVVVAEG